MIDISRYSSLQKLLGIAAYVQRFIMHLLGSMDFCTLVTISEIKCAWYNWIQQIQEDSFSAELQSLLNAGNDRNVYVCMYIYSVHIKKLQCVYIK